MVFICISTVAPICVILPYCMTAISNDKTPSFFGTSARAALECFQKNAPLSIIAVLFEPPATPNWQDLTCERVVHIEDHLRSVLPHHYSARIANTLGIVVPETSELAAVALAQRLIVDRAKEATGNGAVPLGACAGIATIERWRDPMSDLRDAFAESLTALRAAVRRGSGSIIAYTDDIAGSERREAKLARAIRRAAPSGQLRLLYQPIVEIKTQRIVAIESLVRWEHPDLHTVMPSEFIPLARRLECSLEIDRWVLSRALQDLAPMREIAPDLMLHVNICPATLNEAGEGGKVLERIAQSHIPAQSVILEITEDPGQRSAALYANVQTLRDNGVRIALDDLGRGSNSLAFLAELPCDIVKIERSLVPCNADEERKAVVFASIMAACEELNVRMIAEMVETQGQHELLVRTGVTHAQGFHYERPLTAHALRNKMARQTGTEPPLFFG